MASFPRDKNSQYHRVIFRKTVDGKKKSKTFYFRKTEFNRTEVSDWKKRKELEFKDKIWLPWDEPAQIARNGVTLTEVLEHYERAGKKELAASTINRRMTYLRDFADYVGKQRPLKGIDVNKWINQGDVKYLTRRQRHTALRALYKHVVHRMKLLPEIPRMDVISTRAERSSARSNKFKDWLRDEELEKLIKSLHQLDRQIKSDPHAYSPYTQINNKQRLDIEWVFRLVHKTGMRLGDVHNFDIRWIEPDPSMKGKRIIRFSATGDVPKSQTLNEAIPVMPEIVDTVNMLIERGEDKPFRKMNRQWISKTFSKCLEMSFPKKNMTFRNLRDSAANYWLYERNLPLKIVQQILRHADIKTTMIYVHDDLSEVQKHVWNEL